jgi:uncharacterized protein (DUF952 family)
MAAEAGKLPPQLVTMGRIYHIADAALWSAGQGDYFPAAYGDDGFIHCSGAAQVLPVLNSWYLEHDNLVLLAIAVDRLRAELVYENTIGGDELFPHLYGALNRDAVVAVEPLTRGLDGAYDAPEGLRAALDGQP